MTAVQIAQPRSKHLQDQMLRQFVLDHPVSQHRLFERLSQGELKQDDAGALLRNYDAHASHLRRLLLKAATIMPERAVGYILENVRNEYGNGRVEDRHQLQLQDLAWQIGVSRAAYSGFAIQPGIKSFIKDVTAYYYPLGRFAPQPFRLIEGHTIKSRAAVAAGAITATELLALEEFKALQKAFVGFGQEHHLWFNHVTIECEHLEDSVSLALYFLEENANLEGDVLLGLKGVLDASTHLYDGLLACIS